MRKISVKCQLCFDAEIEVEADNLEEAKEIVRDNFRATIGRISGNCDERILDWDVDHCGYPECIKKNKS